MRLNNKHLEPNSAEYIAFMKELEADDANAAFTDSDPYLATFTSPAPAAPPPADTHRGTARPLVVPADQERDGFLHGLVEQPAVAALLARSLAWEGCDE